MDILITGVSSGIGYGLAEHYLASGHTVLGISRRVPKDLVSLGLRHSSADLTNPLETIHALDQLLLGRSQLSLVILNAGIIGRIADMSDVTDAEVRAILEVNLLANKTVFDAIRKHCQRIEQVVAMTSAASQRGRRGFGPYSMSKAALNVLVQVWAEEFPEIHFSALSPGAIDTPLQEALRTLPSDNRFEVLTSLRSRWNTPAMPDQATGTRQLMEMIADLPKSAQSGSYVDVRDWAAAGHKA